MSIATYISPTFDCDQSSFVKFRVVVDVISQSSVDRTSYCRVRLQAWRTNTGYTTYGAGTGYVDADGSQQSQSIISSQTITYNSYTVLVDKYFYVQHGTDGRKLNCQFGGYFSISSPMSGGWDYFYVTLPDIPVASTITAPSGLIEGTTIISINRASSTFKHTLKYSFGSPAVEGTITSLTSATSVEFVIPTSFYAKIPDSKNGICTLTCETYDASNNLLGTKTTTFLANVNEAINEPTISITELIDINSVSVALTNDNSKILKGFSNLKSVLNITAKNSATLSYRKITCGLKSAEIFGATNPWTNTLLGVSDGVVTIIATDSRGITKTLTVNKTLINYIPLTANPNFERVSPTSSEVVVTYDGDYFNNTFGVGGVANTLTIAWSYRILNGVWAVGSVPLTDVKVGNRYSNGDDPISVGSIYPYSDFYEFKITISDKLTQIEVTDLVKKGIPPMAVKDDRVEFDVPIFIKNASGVLGSLVDLFYPIGSIIISEGNNNPQSRFVDTTWEVYGTGRVLVGYDVSQTEFNSGGKTGGAKVHTLTSNEMPIHTHTQDAHNHSQNAHQHNIDHDYDGAGGSSRYTVHNGAYVSGATTTSWVTASNIAATATNQNAGGGQAHNNLPPYIVVYYWKRTA
ncbi:MAG: hypothetical protein FD141_351 [Fusobacteria bacterium]|nr:MAG: hypothetical protein FD141_351 [Fusobacteriota bacterium]KAF0228984.1 MAG: hypothetical protein FD182_1240 [Fusobacteriota bacterium]